MNNNKDENDISTDEEVFFQSTSKNDTQTFPLLPV